MMESPLFVNSGIKYFDKIGIENMFIKNARVTIGYKV